MKIAVTGATGFVGIELVKQLLQHGHSVRAWHRESSNLDPLLRLPDASNSLELIRGSLGDGNERQLIDGCDAVVHSGLWRESQSFQQPPTSLTRYAEVNVLGSLALMETAIECQVERFIFLSTCAVHDVILDDRPLDEAHPLWPKTHYGAHKAAIETFVHSLGLGQGFPICSLRPTGIYGVKTNVEDSKWYPLIQRIIGNETIEVARGGKEVHVSDVAKSIRILLDAEPDQIAGQSFACYDRYISEYDVATIAKAISASQATILGEQRRPKNQINTKKIQDLGMSFGGQPLLEITIGRLIALAR
ncbi:MAG: NAD-dependent epimerase/dehydratase [Planctomycetota bacterium]